MTPFAKLNSPTELDALKRKAISAIQGCATRVLVCGGTGCMANGGPAVLDALQKALEKHEVPVRADIMREEDEDAITIGYSGCPGYCQVGPIVRILPADYFYVQVKPEDADDIVTQTVMNGKPVDRLLFKDENNSYAKRDDLPFYKDQVNVVLADCGVIEPGDIRDYIARDGYRALAEALFGLTPEAVVAEVTESGLRGRGGAGFSTGRKWGFTQVVQSAKKYVVCNADEGDPGAFMDESIMEGNPHALLEGMAIAGYAIGADEGYIYVRAEYPLAISRLRTAISQAEQAGLLGDRILGGPFSFHIHIKEGAGAFVCGEETALISSIEGQRGMPRPKPPFPANSGLWGKPTVVNNVETFANVSKIILNGAEWFRSFGIERSPGTKVFALTGDVVNTGLIEVPMGTTLGDVVFKIGGGIRTGRPFKAVQIGGPSGACLTEEHLDLPLDYDSLKSVGAMVGSGGLVVMDDSTCMVEIARFFMSFTQKESCGKCVLCREGTKRMLDILTRIVSGKGKVEDISLLEELALTVRDGSLCGLGKSAPNPVISTLKHFRDEYLAHIVDGVCPAGECESFKAYSIVSEKCKGCGLCAKKCPVNAISGELKSPYVIDATLCTRCGVCAEVCKFDAVVLS
ncbi:MAG: NADH-quinone oxidoreductase subunit NuoF [Armatimonadetes bacterium]|jgi:NADH-quinone oxidoreductase subunit F|nr:NADH-quinone oxidoreductase subunit NuoF [Armatimonadota bacterium]